MSRMLCYLGIVAAVTMVCSCSSAPPGPSQCRVRELPFEARFMTDLQTKTDTGWTPYKLGNGIDLLVSLPPPHRFDAPISFGLDWIPVEPDDYTRLDATPPLGWGMILYRDEDGINAYGWGPQLLTVFPDDFTEPDSTALIWTDVELGQDTGGIDYNGWALQDAESASCFQPPGDAPYFPQIFYCDPREPLVIKSKYAHDPGGGWTLLPEFSVLDLRADPSWPPFLDSASAAEAMAFDKEHRLIVMSFATAAEEGEGEEPTPDVFYVFGVDNITYDENGAIQSFQIDTARTPAVLHRPGEPPRPMGTIVPKRPVHTCSSVDPRRLLYKSNQ